MIPPQDRPLDLLLEDGPLLAFNKPAGLLTQGVPRGLPTLESRVKEFLKERHAKPGNVYLGVPHRLDRPVSGVIVFARNSKAAARLAEMFRERQVEKRYLALVEGTPAPAGRFEDHLLKDPEAAETRVVAEGTPGAKHAALAYDVLAASGGLSLVEVRLETGRMHQIRVQFASRGFPVVADQQYGSRRCWPGWDPADVRDAPIALHAARLSLKHPIRYDDVTITAPLPGDWTHWGVSVPAEYADAGRPVKSNTSGPPTVNGPAAGDA